MKQNLNDWYNKYYRWTLLFPLVIIICCFIITGTTIIKTGDILPRDVSLTGGTSITVSSNILPNQVREDLSSKISNVEVRSLYDSSGKQTHLIITTSEELEKVRPIIEQYLGFNLTSSNSTIESTGSSLSKDFYKQLMIAVLIAFFWMACVVFVIFAHGGKIKFLAILLNLLLGFFLGELFFSLNIFLSVIILVLFMCSLIYIYIKNSIPSFAVMSCAFFDIIMTLAVVDLIGMKLSAAGVVAFLMLIGYSVDTDILLTARVLKMRRGSVNREIFSAFKTGMTMSLAAISAVTVALFFVYSFETSLNQIFTILLIGLVFDIMNTWVTNTALLKWFLERSEK